MIDDLYMPVTHIGCMQELCFILSKYIFDHALSLYFSCVDSHIYVLECASRLTPLPFFVCYAAFRPKSIAVVMAGWSVHLTTLFPGQACPNS